MEIQFLFEKKPLFFENPLRIISCFDESSVEKCFSEIEDEIKKGVYLAGFFSYEMGNAFEKKIQKHKGYDFPLIYLGVYDKIQFKNILSESKNNFSLNELEIITFNTSKKVYFNNIEKIKRFIERGDVYQITYCIKLFIKHIGDKRSLFNALFSFQPVPYAAMILDKNFTILSFSPEMFIKKIGTKIITKPMKGTWFREGIVNNILGGLLLKFDQKNRAENVMIADLLRNDLGKIAKNISVPKLFEVTRYKTLFQMTSTVVGDIEKDISIYKIFKALHPSGSVSGAPKIRAMQIIDEIEKEERKIYTGAIGYILPNRDIFFNVPIRTMLFNGFSGEMGIGGGIVWDSTPEGEWNECMIKSKFILLDKQINFG